MGISQQLGKAAGGFGKGLLQGIVGWLYQKLFAEEIAADKAERDKLLAELASYKAAALAKVADDQKQIDQAEAEKKPIQDAIKVEEKRQTADEAQIAQVKDDEKKAVDRIRSESDADALRGNF
jgi:flagellar biosynthesis GTPase FlhF